MKFTDSFWNYRWSNSSWTPVEGPISLTDNVGNKFSYYSCNVSLTSHNLVTDVAAPSGSAPSVYSLSQNYPNPFNPSTTIKFYLPKTTSVSLVVYDLLGREVAVLVNDPKDAGVHQASFDGSTLASGVYIYRLQAGSFVQSKKLLLLK